MLLQWPGYDSTRSLAAEKGVYVEKAQRIYCGKDNAADQRHIVVLRKALFVELRIHHLHRIVLHLSLYTKIQLRKVSFHWER